MGWIMKAKHVLDTLNKIVDGEIIGYNKLYDYYANLPLVADKIEAAYQRGAYNALMDVQEEIESLLQMLDSVDAG